MGSYGLFGLSWLFKIMPVDKCKIAKIAVGLSVCVFMCVCVMSCNA